MRKQSKKTRKTGRIVLSVFAIAIALAPAVLTSKFGFGFSPILTGSMEPKAQPGDVFITRLVPVTTVVPGDIIAVNNQATGVYYSHRVVEVRDINGTLRIITKGDANESADRDPFMVSPLASVSKVVFKVPFIGRPMVYMNTIQGRQTATSLIVVANFLALFMFLFRKKIIPNFNGERVYKELYLEERKNSEQYREIIDNLQIALAEERIENSKAIQ